MQKNRPHLQVYDHLLLEYQDDNNYIAHVVTRFYLRNYKGQNVKGQNIF